MTDIKTYRQERDAQFLKDHPNETWRCDILPVDGSDHHGVGATEAWAVFHPVQSWLAWNIKNRRMP